MSYTHPHHTPFLETYPTLEGLLKEHENVAPWFLKWTTQQTACTPKLATAAGNIPLNNWLYLREQLIAQNQSEHSFQFLNAFSSLLSLAHQGLPVADTQAKLAEVQEIAQEVIRLMTLALEAKDFWNKDEKMQRVVELMHQMVGDLK